MVDMLIVASLILRRVALIDRGGQSPVPLLSLFPSQKVSGSTLPPAPLPY